ncbi:hypothetical protein CLOM_g5285 [Closterium sp. NIES-68]|nr:hypothetical protein CLOM_g5285 [Closterium sp. NIES-68]GJP68009.1 hypothetical protein CLOP_g24765 [Closterium sp. NIES-67]
MPLHLVLLCIVPAGARFLQVPARQPPTALRTRKDPGGREARGEGNDDVGEVSLEEPVQGHNKKGDG